MPYYEIPYDPKLTLEDVRARLAKEMQSEVVIRRHHVAVENGPVAVAVHLTQLSGRTMLRVVGTLPGGSYFRLLLMILIPPAGLGSFYLMNNPKFPLFTAVEYALCETGMFPGIRKIKPGTGTRLARPTLNIVVQLAWIAAGLWVAWTGIDWSSYWVGPPSRPFRELVVPALLFALGGVWIVSGVYKLFRPPLGWLVFFLIMAGFALLSPLVFRAWPR